MRALTTLPGDENASSTQDVNDAGTVVGMSGATPVLWEGTNFTIRPIPGLSSLRQPRPSAINNAGVIIGTSGEGSFLWANGSVTVLPSNFQANRLNDSGIVAGSIVVPLGPQKPMLWQNGVETALPLLPLDDPNYAVGAAAGINRAGVSVGTSEVRFSATQFEPHAVVWRNGQPTDLNPLIQPAPINSGGMDINTQGDIVLIADRASYLYKDGVMRSIKQLIPNAGGWIEAQAYHINDRGEVLILDGNAGAAAVVSPNNLL